MVRQTIYHVKTETLSQDDEAATIRLHGLRRTCIHPVFAYVAKLFRIGQTHAFEETLELTKEDGRWKVCGAPFGPPVKYWAIILRPSAWQRESLGVRFP